MPPLTPWCYDGSWICGICARTSTGPPLWVCGERVHRGGTSASLIRRGALGGFPPAPGGAPGTPDSGWRPFLKNDMVDLWVRVWF